MPKDHQTVPELASVTTVVIAYEGMIKKSHFPESEHLKGPVAQGDGPLWVPGKNPPESQLSVYGSGHVGVFGSIIQTTIIPGILQLDLLATDFYRDYAYPTFLYYNPYKTTKKITVQTGDRKRVDLYNLVTQQFIARSILKNKTIEIPASDAVVVVCIPANGKINYDDNKMLVNGVIIDYHLKQ